jgi:hypothetical protein
MRSRVNKKLLAAILAALFLFGAIPNSSAADIPSLTWERGKEQNIVLGGNSIPASWSIRMMDEKEINSLSFVRSKPNAKGYLVYSVFVPADFPIGYYAVKVFGEGSTAGSLVAGINIIGMRTYSITQIPTDLRNIILWLALVITSFSTMRSKKYAKHSYLRQADLVEEEALLSDKRFPKLLYRAYKLRQSVFAESTTSLFKHFLKRDGSLSHRIDPRIWTIMPAVGVIVGLFSGFATKSNAPIVPVFYLAALALIGLFDSYSGFFAAFGFATAQVILGQATSLKSFLILITLGLSWSACVLFGELLFSMAKRDFKGIKLIGKEESSKEFVIIPSAILAGSLFYYLQFLAHSLSVVPFTNNLEVSAIAVLVGLLFIARNSLSNKLDMNLAKDPKNKFIAEEFEIQALINPTAVLIIGIYFIAIIYVWTLNWGVAFVPGLIMTAPFAALLIRLEKPEFRILTKWKRNIYFEALLVALISFGLYWIVSKTPNEVIHKSEILLAVGFIPVLFHAALSSLYDVTGNREVQ